MREGVRCLPVNGAGVEDSCHTWSRGVTNGEGSDVALVTKAVLAEAGIYASVLDVAFDVCDWLSVRHIHDEDSGVDPGEVYCFVCEDL